MTNICTFIGTKRDHNSANFPDGCPITLAIRTIAFATSHPVPVLHSPGRQRFRCLYSFRRRTLSKATLWAALLASSCTSALLMSAPTFLLHSQPALSASDATHSLAPALVVRRSDRSAPHRCGCNAMCRVQLLLAPNPACYRDTYLRQETGLQNAGSIHTTTKIQDMLTASFHNEMPPPITKVTVTLKSGIDVHVN